MSGEGDSWVFDSLVNFLHGNIWKIPVMGFIEEKSVVFDPDSYNNLTDDKEDEFKKIHEDYKALVDFMLASFMEDLQVTPEQVEEACQLRGTQSTVSESLITKVALEQLQAAEDFTIFRRIMTRKNIDLQLQSLELLVAKYGVLSPSLRPQDADDSIGGGDNGEEDFLQVVLRYSTDGSSDLFNLSPTATTPTATTPTSTYANTSLLLRNASIESATMHSKTSLTTMLHAAAPVMPDKLTNIISRNQHEKLATVTVAVGANKLKNDSQKMQLSDAKYTTSYANFESGSSASTARAVDTQQSLQNLKLQANNAVEKSDPFLKKSQLIQQEEAWNLKQSEDLTPATPSQKGSVGGKETGVTVHRDPGDDPKLCVMLKTTAAEIVTVAPEQHRILTSVRQALDMSSEEGDSDVTSALELEAGGGSEEEIQRRREYLGAQRDKLVALKKKERARQLVIHGDGSGDAGQVMRPKSAKAAQMALTTPPQPRPSGSNEKSLAARRALAKRLKHELMDK